MAARRFPTPWTVDECTQSFIVRDADGFPVAYVYFTDYEQRAAVTDRMSRDEARRIAANMARLPEPLEETRAEATPTAEIWKDWLVWLASTAIFARWYREHRRGAQGAPTAQKLDVEEQARPDRMAEGLPPVSGRRRRRRMRVRR